MTKLKGLFVGRKSMGVCETLQYAPGGNKVENIAAAFQGMHVSPAKHSDTE